MKARTYILATDIPNHQKTLETLEAKGYCDEVFGMNFSKNAIDKTMIYVIHVELAVKDQIVGAKELLQVMKEQNADFILVDFAKRIETQEIDQSRIMAIHAAQGKFGNESVINLK